MAYHFTVLVEESTSDRPDGDELPEGMFESASWQGRRMFLGFREAVRWIVAACHDEPQRFRAITQVHSVPEVLPAAPVAGPTREDYGARVSIGVDQRVGSARRRGLRRRVAESEDWSWQRRVGCTSHVEAIEWIARNAGSTPLFRFRVAARVLDLPGGPDEAGPLRSLHRMLTERGELGRASVLFVDLVRADPVLQRYFPTDDPQRFFGHSAAYLRYATGGGAAPEPSELFRTHGHLHVSREAWDRLAALLAEALTRLGFPPAVLDTITATVQPTRGLVVTGPPREHERRVSDGLRSITLRRAPPEPPAAAFGSRLNEPPPPA